MANKWDVVLIGFPFTDLKGIKVRPAVIISPDNFHQLNQDALFMLITSNVSRNSPYDVHVGYNHSDYQMSGLIKESMIRVGKLITLERSLIKATIGAVGPTLKLEVEQSLRTFLELAPFQPPLVGQ